MICGIYAIKNNINGKLYVGQSKDIQSRYRQHCSSLKKNKHYNLHLQKNYNKYGEFSFDLIILEECDIISLGINEQKWIDNFPRNNLYNQIFDVQYRQGENNPFFGKKHNEKSKIIMSEFKKTAYIGEGNPNYGKKHTQETKIKMSEGRGKLSSEKVNEIADLLKNGWAHQEIADKFNICRTAITRISNGTRWKNITGGPIVPVVYVDGKRQLSDTHRKNMSKKINYIL